MIRLPSKLELGCVVLLAGISACAGAEPVPTATPVQVSGPATTAPTAAPVQKTEETAAPEVRISIWLSWKPAGIRAFNELIQSFQVRYPRAMFSVSYIPASELRLAIDDAAGDGSLPSVFLAPSAWGPELLERGTTLDLAGQATNELKALLHPLAWSQVDWGGQILGLPLQMHGNVLYRNRGLVPVPAATVESLVTTAQAFRGTERVGFSLDYGYPAIGPFSLACGGTLLQEGAPPDLEGPVVPCWLELLKELSPAGPIGFNTEDDRLRFEAGEAGWLIESSERYDELRSILGDAALAVDPWPVYQGSGEPLAGYVWTENVYFRPDLRGDEFEIAWAFIGSLLSADAQLTLSNPLGASNLPVHAATAPPVGAPGQMQDAILGGLALPLWSADVAYLEILERAARAVSVQGAEVDTALRRAIADLGDV